MPVRMLVAGAAAVAAASAWFNQGFFSHDEHFQILEFAWYKLGRTPPDALAWEFHARIRPALQPWLAAGLFKGLGLLGLFTPLFAAFTLRLISGALGLWVSLLLCARVAPWIGDSAFRRLLLPGMLFLWFLPYTHGRFASENWGGLLFFAGLCVVLDARDPNGGRHPALRGALAGLLWGGAFYCRFQMGLAIAGAGLWLIVIDSANPRVLLSLAASFLAACALNVALDHWLYGEWVCTPCNYFNANVVAGTAATFGTEPWWFYLAQILGLLVPPFSPLLVALLGVCAWRCSKNLLVWTAVPFLVGHNLLGHKEVRFLIPLTYSLVPLLVLGADRLSPPLRGRLIGWLNTRPVAPAIWVFAGLNLCALSVMTVKPSSETAVIYRRLYEKSQEGPIVLYSTSRLPYSMAGNAVDFYRPDNLTLKAVAGATEVRAAIAAAPGRVFFFDQSLQPPGWMAASRIQTTPVAQTIPVWASRFNVNNWMSRVYLWSVFSLSASAPDAIRPAHS